jgi:capsular exopolysaccharide synthesis family protein
LFFKLRGLSVPIFIIVLLKGMEASTPKSLPAGLQLINQLMAYIKYGRLMGLLFIIGILMGVSYFVFSPSVYFSRSLIDLKIFALPITADGDGGPRFLRNLVGQLNSRQMIAWTAHRLGVGKPSDSFETLREGPLKQVEVGVLDNGTLQVTVYSRHAWVVREFPKALVDQYESYYREQRLEWMSVGIKKYQDELKELRAKIDEKLKGQVNFERTNDVTTVMIEQNSLAQVPLDVLYVQHKLRKFEELESILVSRRERGVEPLEELSLLESAKETINKSVNTNLVGQLLPASGDVKDALVNPAGALALPPSQSVVVQPSMIEGLRPWQQLEKDKRNIEREIGESSRIYLEDAEVMKRLRDRLRQNNQSIIAELGVERQRFDVEHRRLQAELKSLEAKLPEYSRITEKLNKVRQDYVLGQDGDVAWNAAYASLNKMLTSIQYGVDKERVDLSFRSYSQLRDENPVSPTKSKLAMIAISLAFGLALGIPFGLEQLNDRITSMEALEAATGLKGIGIIPKSTSEFLEDVTRPVESDVRKPNNVLECYRVLRAHLKLQLDNKPGTKVVMFTSSRPSEGKTVTAANVAWALQGSGSKTLVVDLDFRRGRQHKLFKDPRGPGFCQALSGQMKLQDVVRHTNLPNLDYCARGETVAGSSELLCRLGLEEAIEEWKKTYDWIILDTPPVLGLSETTSLQRVADGVVIIIKADSTYRRDVIDAVTQIKKSGAKIFGVVLNNVDLSKLSNYYYYYYSSAHYYQSFDEDPVTENSIKRTTA